MKTRLTFLFMALFVLGCEVSTDRKVPAPNNRVLPIDAIRNLTVAEQTIGTRICEAAQEARYRYESYNDREMIFTFDFFRRSCEESNYSAPSNVEAYFRKTIAGNVMLQPISNNDLLDDLLTDTHPFLNSLCEKLLAGEEASNTLDQNGNRYVYIINQVQGFDAIEVVRYSQDREGNYMMRNSEAYRLYTEISTSNIDYHGLVFERVQVTPCEAQNRTRATRQILKGFRRI